jgi:uncharacterized protein YecE (DUF72 family)
VAVRIGTAGWAIPRLHRERFPEAGSGLERYAARLNCAEINSTFYRPHRPATFERWRETTPEHFRFAVKLPRTISHERRLADSGDLLAGFLGMIAPLGDKLGPLLVQLPPSQPIDPAVAGAFLTDLRRRHAGPVAWEPRHASWFTPEAEALLAAHAVARVAADPAKVPAAAVPGGAATLRYWRLHGSPDMYRTPYGPQRLDALAAEVAASEVETWVIFDNTTTGAAAGDALDLAERLG